MFYEFLNQSHDFIALPFNVYCVSVAIYKAEMRFPFSDLFSGS